MKSLKFSSSPVVRTHKPKNGFNSTNSTKIPTKIPTVVGIPALEVVFHPKGARETQVDSTRYLEVPGT